MLNRHADTSLSAIELISSYRETMSNCQSIFTFVKWFILELFLKTKNVNLAKVIGFKPINKDIFALI